MADFGICQLFYEMLSLFNEMSWFVEAMNGIKKTLNAVVKPVVTAIEAGFRGHLPKLQSKSRPCGRLLNPLCVIGACLICGATQGLPGDLSINTYQ